MLISFLLPSVNFRFNLSHYRLRVFTYANKTSPSVSLSINGEGGGNLEGLRPLYICSELLRKVPSTAISGLKPCLKRNTVLFIFYPDLL